MSIFSSAAKNIMLESLGITSVSLHTAYSAIGANEVTGGLPAYARLAVTFAAATGGQKQLTAAPYTFHVPPTTVAWLGLWNASATFMGMVPTGSGAIQPFAVDDALFADTLKCAAHGLGVGGAVVVWAGDAGFLPIGLSDGTTYYVATIPSLNTLQLSATLGGGAIALLSVGNGFIQSVVSTTYTAQSTFVLNALTLDATVAA